ncbi:MAG: ABC transporter permease [Anaerolineae bacterium]|nr:ABC transporter permease [Anaerolineae bacterium]
MTVEVESKPLAATTLPSTKRKVPYYLRVDSSAQGINFAELWDYREALYHLLVRDIKLRYRQTILGALWAVLRPLITMVVFTVFFNTVAQVSSDGLPYPVFSFAALVPWTLFSDGIGMAADSLVGQAHLVRKVYFPRLYIPLGRIFGGVIDYGLSLIVLVGLAFAFGLRPSLAAVWVIPLLTLLILGLTVGVSLWFSALNVRYRDVRYLVPFMLQIWMFASPVIYPASKIDESLRVLYSINPMVVVIEGFRSVLLGGDAPTLAMVAVAVAVTAVILTTGMLFFHRAEGVFADVI